MNIDLEKIGKYIASLRASKNISQGELASFLAVTRSAVSKWENGKGLPDVTLLIKLANYFDVTVDLILTGGEVSSSKDNKVILGLVEVINSKGEKIKFLRRILTFLVCFLIVILMGVYFISNYNSIKIFRINSSESNLISNNGILVMTKDKSYLRLGDVILNKDKITKVRLYYLDEDNKRKIVFEDIESDILITSKFGYEEYFSYDDLELMKDNLYLEVVYDDSLEKIKLKLEEDFSNKSFVFFRKRRVELDKNTDEYLLNLSLFSKKIIKKIKELGKYENDRYLYSLSDSSKDILISYDLGKIDLEIRDGNSLKKWIYYINNEKEIDYFDISDNQNDLRINLDKKLSSKEVEVKEEFFEIIKKYLW